LAFNKEAKIYVDRWDKYPVPPSELDSRSVGHTVCQVCIIVGIQTLHIDVEELERSVWADGDLELAGRLSEFEVNEWTGVSVGEVTMSEGEGVYMQFEQTRRPFPQSMALLRIRSGHSPDVRPETFCPSWSRALLDGSLSVQNQYHVHGGGVPPDLHTRDAQAWAGPILPRAKDCIRIQAGRKSQSIFYANVSFCAACNPVVKDIVNTALNEDRHFRYESLPLPSGQECHAKQIRVPAMTRRMNDL
jgi:hypothetical protein